MNASEVEVVHVMIKLAVQLIDSLCYCSEAAKSLEFIAWQPLPQNWLI